MRKRYLILLLPLLIVGLTGTAYGWQGRMGGMGDPFGLVADESDYLIHPAKIATGEGIRFYGDYRFLYTGVLKWDYAMDIFTSAGVLYAVFNRDGSGDEQRHEVLLGSSFPLGPGRLGLFFTYDGMRGESDGDQPEWYPPAVPIYYDTYELTSELDNFAFRLLYGLPVGGFNLGGEVQFAYRQEENKALYDEDYSGGVRDLYTNYFWGGLYDYENTFPLMLPYDSQYWEALFKVSVEGKVGPLDLEFTPRAGFLFAGDNQYEYKDDYPVPTPYAAICMKGDVTGWRIGGDLWLRYPLAGDLSLPFLVRVDYEEKTRDGDGPGQLDLDGYNYAYENEEQSLGITAGGGLEKELANGAKIAGGIYYRYLQGNSAIKFTETETGTGNWWIYDYSDVPASREHQVMLRLAGEFALSPVVTLRMGLAPFFGWVRQDFKYSYLNSAPSGYTDDVPTDGYHWGIGASLGGTIKIPPVTLEPFINGGYQQLNLEGDGNSVNSSGAITNLYEISKDRNEWFIGGGFTVLFDVP